MDKRIVVGRFSGVFGTRGWLKVVSYTRPPDNLLGYAPWSVQIDGQWRLFEPVESRRHHGGFIVSGAGISDPDAAATFVAADISVMRAQLPEAEKGEYYWHDLVGLNVFNVDGHDLGRVAALLETPAHDVLKVSGERERLIPLVMGVYVLDVDLQRGVMRVDWHSAD